MSMKKALLGAAMLLGVSSGAAQAATFDWSYTFGNTKQLSGVFDGTLGVDLDTITVSAVSNVSFDGTPYLNALFLSAITNFPSGGGTPIVTISGLLMDLCADTIGDCTGDGFYFDTGVFGALTDLPGGITSGADNPFVAQSWIISERVAPVPLPAALPLLAAGLGAMGFMGWRKKRKALTA